MQRFFYIVLFPLMFIFPTVNLFAYFGLNISQMTLTNIGIILFIAISLFYTKIDIKLLAFTFFLIIVIFVSTIISIVTLSDEAILRAGISLVYYFFIFMILISIGKTAQYLFSHNKSHYIYFMFRNIGLFALIFFYIVTLYQNVFLVSPTLLSSDPTLGYRDFRHPIVNGIHLDNLFRALGTFPEPSMYAGFIVTLLPFMRYKNLYINLFILFLALESVLMTYSRIGMILLVVYALLYFALIKRKVLAILVLTFICFSSISVDTFMFEGKYIINNIERLFSMIEHMDVSIMTRVLTPLVFFSHSDIQLLIGYGLGNFIDIFPLLDLDEGYLQFKVPTLNNFYLNFIAEFGLISFVLFIGVIIYFVRQVINYKVHVHNKELFMAFILMLFYFFQVGHLSMIYVYFLLILSAVSLYYKLLEAKRTCNS